MEISPKRFLDTVVLKHTYLNLPPVKEFLSDKWFKKKITKDGILAVYIFNVPRNSRSPRMTFSQSANYVWHLSAEVSFAAWQRGSNVQLCHEAEIPNFLNFLSDEVSAESGLTFDAFRAKVCRIDVAEDIQVGAANITRIIKDVSRTKLNGFVRHNIDDETVLFKNKGQTLNLEITFYDKFKQACKEYPNAPDLDLARDILRQEVRLRKTQLDKVVKDLNLPNLSAEVLLTQAVAEHILNYGKEIVHFDLSLKENDDWIFELAKKLPITKVILIVGFVVLLRRLGSDFYLLDIFDFNKRSYQRYIKKCFDAGINPYE